MIAASQHPYAAALLELTEEQGVTDAVRDQARDLAELIDGDADLRHVLESPALSAEQRQGILEKALGGRVHDTLLKLVLVMNRKGRAGRIAAMCRAFDRLVDQHRGVVEVKAEVAQPLDDAAAGQLREQISAALGGRTVQLHTHVNPDLIGGLRLQIGDKLIDGSVVSRLNKMRSELVRRGREAARAAS